MRLAACASCVFMLLAACTVQGLNFFEDTRLAIVSPQDLADVAAPVEIRWRFEQEDDTVASYLVLVDRVPQPPGESLRWFLDDASDCRGVETVCPSTDYLATRGVYWTTEQRLVIDAIPPRAGVAKGQEHLHDLVIVLLDIEGRRVGEAAARVTIQIIDRHGRG